MPKFAIERTITMKKVVEAVDEDDAYSLAEELTGFNADEFYVEHWASECPAAPPSKGEPG